jgi:hypothetical protein
MKSLTAFTVFILLTINLFAQSKATIGMSMQEVKNLYPQVESSAYENTITLSYTDTLYGLSGQWGYRFENNKLNWIHFDRYIDEIKKSNFDKCLSATNRLIKEYTKSFGKPDTTIVGNRNFIDPYKKHHYGYNVIEARWNNYNDMKIKVEFTFFGGKGEYHFIVIINYFPKDYPYFD